MNKIIFYSILSMIIISSFCMGFMLNPDAERKIVEIPKIRTVYKPSECTPVVCECSYDNDDSEWWET